MSQPNGRAAHCMHTHTYTHTLTLTHTHTHTHSHTCTDQYMQQGTNQSCSVILVQVGFSSFYCACQDVVDFGPGIEVEEEEVGEESGHGSDQGGEVPEVPSDPTDCREQNE